MVGDALAKVLTLRVVLDLKEDNNALARLIG
jgi:hypothetical protein